MSGFHMTMHIVFVADVNTASKPVRDTHMKIMKTKRNRATAKKKITIIENWSNPG